MSCGRAALMACDRTPCARMRRDVIGTKHSSPLRRHRTRPATPLRVLLGAAAMDGPSTMQVDSPPVRELPPVALLASLDDLPDSAALALMNALPIDARAVLACTSRRWRRVGDTPSLWTTVRLAGAHPRCITRLHLILRHARIRAGELHLRKVDLRGVPCAETVGLSACKRHLDVGNTLAAELLAAQHLTFLHTGEVAAFTPSAVTRFSAARAGGGPLDKDSFVSVAYNAEAHLPPVLVQPPLQPALLLVPPGCDVALRPLDQVPLRFNNPILHQPGLRLAGALRAVAACQAYVTGFGAYVKVGQAVMRHWQELLAVAQHHPTLFARLRHLDLRGMEGTANDLAAIAQLLASPACVGVETLNLAGSRGVGGASPALLAAAAQLPSLTELDVSHIAMNEERCAALGDGLVAAAHAGRSTHVKLDIGHCEMRDAGLARCLSSALSAGCAFTTLVLSSNGLSDAAVVELCAALGAPVARCPLRRLVLSSNVIRAAGASALAGAITSGVLPLLTHLDVSDNMLREEGGAVLAASLGSPSCRLQTLDVATCRLGDDGLRYFAEALRGNSELRNLHVADAGATDAGILALAAGLEAATLAGNTALEVLQVGSISARCSDAALERLQAAGQRLQTCWFHRPKIPPTPPLVFDEAEAGPSRPEP